MIEARQARQARRCEREGVRSRRLAAARLERILQRPDPIDPPESHDPPDLDTLTLAILGCLPSRP